jgi:hypothetical protein
MPPIALGQSKMGGGVDDLQLGFGDLVYETGYAMVRTYIVYLTNFLCTSSPAPSRADHLLAASSPAMNQDRYVFVYR